MGKTRRSPRDLDDLRSLKDKNRKLGQENKALRREVATLRKQISNLDVDRKYDVQDLIDAYDKTREHLDNRKELLNKWRCYECGRGHLLLTVLKTRVDSRYYRRCNLCAHKTRIQSYTEGIEGITEADLK